MKSTRSQSQFSVAVFSDKNKPLAKQFCEQTTLIPLKTSNHNHLRLTQNTFPRFNAGSTNGNSESLKKTTPSKLTSVIYSVISLKNKRKVTLKRLKNKFRVSKRTKKRLTKKANFSTTGFSKWAERRMELTLQLIFSTKRLV